MPSAVEDHSIKQLTAGEVPTSAAAETVMAAAVEKAVDASELLFHIMLPCGVQIITWLSVLR